MAMSARWKSDYLMSDTGLDVRTVRLLFCGYGDISTSTSVSVVRCRMSTDSIFNCAPVTQKQRRIGLSAGDGHLATGLVTVIIYAQCAVFCFHRCAVFR